MRIIGISGKRGSGKDTLANQLVARGWTKLSFAAMLKAHVREFFDMTAEQTDGELKEIVDTRYQMSPRRIMIDIGQFYRRFDPLFWVKRTINNLDPNNRYVISDLRFHNEALFLLSRGANLVRLNRRKDLNIYQGEINDPSEVELDNFNNWDIIVREEQNVCIEDLVKLANELDNYGVASLKKSL